MPIEIKDLSLGRVNSHECLSLVFQQKKHGLIKPDTHNRMHINKMYRLTSGNIALKTGCKEQPQTEKNTVWKMISS